MIHQAVKHPTEYVYDRAEPTQSVSASINRNIVIPHKSTSQKGNGAGKLDTSPPRRCLPGRTLDAPENGDTDTQQTDSGKRRQKRIPGNQGPDLADHRNDRVTDSGGKASQTGRNLLRIPSFTIR